MKPKQFTEEKGGVVHVHFEPEGTYIRQDDVYRLMQEYADQQLILSGVVSSEITVSDLNQEFIIIRDDLVEIEKGSVVVLLTLNSNGKHEFMDRNNDLCWFEADCVKKKRVI